MHLAFSHFVRTSNAGDVASGPYHYFDFPEHDVVHFGDRLPDCDAVIFGGGAIGNGLGGAAHASGARVTIAWGVGMTRHGRQESGPAPRNLTLYGSREWGQAGAVYAPCPSCMSLLFDRSYPIEHEAVAFLNADLGIVSRYPVDTGHLPVLRNDAAMPEIVRFLGSGATVVTNSYHGAYWATLLGRKVELRGAYSSKFFAYRFPPGQAYPDALEAERASTLAFRGRVMDMLNG